MDRFHELFVLVGKDGNGRDVHRDVLLACDAPVEQGGSRFELARRGRSLISFRALDDTVAVTGANGVSARLWRGASHALAHSDVLTLADGSRLFQENWALYQTPPPPPVDEGDTRVPMDTSDIEDLMREPQQVFERRENGPANVFRVNATYVARRFHLGECNRYLYRECLKTGAGAEVSPKQEKRDVLVSALDAAMFDKGHTFEHLVIEKLPRCHTMNDEYVGSNWKAFQELANFALSHRG
jgi:hypothetical protein